MRLQEIRLAIEPGLDSFRVPISCIYQVLKRDANSVAVGNFFSFSADDLMGSPAAAWYFTSSSKFMF